MMLWDTGISCGSTTSQDQLFIRCVHDEQGKRSRTTSEITEFNCGRIRTVIVAFIDKDNDPVFILLNNS